MQAQDVYQQHAVHQQGPDQIVRARARHAAWSLIRIVASATLSAACRPSALSSRPESRPSYTLGAHWFLRAARRR